MKGLLQDGKLGRYEVIELIGSGGVASVFRGRDPVLDREVAIKVLRSDYLTDEAFVGRFRREAQTVARLGHPNILEVHDFGEEEGCAYLVTALITGGPLQRLMDGRLGLHRALSLTAPVASALDYAHGHGVVHRDVKPGNILLEPDGKPILADFGLARILDGRSTFTDARAILGTPEYISPEQVLGRPADHRSDVYSLGVVVYEMLLGRPPFNGDTPTSTALAHVNEPAPAPQELASRFGPAVREVVLKALAKEPEDRFQTAGELVHALASASPEPGALARISGKTDWKTTAFESTSHGSGGLAAVPRSRPSLSVFLVEDHPLVLEAVRRLLEGDPDIAVVGEAGDAETAIDQLGSTDCDVVVMDIALPGLSGIEATRRIKAMRPDMNVLILSAYGEQSLTEAIEAGADGYMMKTAAPEELRAAVHEVHRGHSPIHPSLSRSLFKKVAGRTEPAPVG